MHRRPDPAGRRAAWPAVLAAALVAAVPAWAQSYRVRIYTAVDGLPSSQVNDIAQDSTGRIWVATRAGVAVHDGTLWKTYSVGDGLTAPDQGRLLITPEDEIWSVASDPPVRVSRFDGRSWHELPQSSVSPPLMRVRQLASAVVDGRRQFVALFPRTLHHWDGVRWRRREMSREESPSSVVWYEDRFLVGTSGGLQRLDPRTGELFRETLPGLPPGPLIGMGWTEDGLWIIGRRWIGRLRGGRLDVEDAGRDLLPRTFDLPLVLAGDGLGGAYLGHTETLFHYRPGVGVATLGAANGLDAGGPTGILRDREGIVWMAGLRGVTKIVSRRFANYTSAQGLLRDEVAAIERGSDGGVVLGHPGGLTFLPPAATGLLPAGPGRRRLWLGPDELEGRVMDLEWDRRGDLWVAQGWRGLVRVTPGGQVQRLGFPAGARSVNAVVVDQKGAVWVGSLGGVHRVAADRFVEVPMDGLDLPALPYVRRMVAAPDGSILAAVQGAGVIRFADERITRWSNPGGELDNNVYTVLTARDGTVWVGTGTGLQRVDGGRLRYAEPPMPAVRRPVYLLVEGQDGTLWIGTDNGAYSWRRGVLRHHTVMNGLAGSETNRAAGLVDGHGRVWLGTDQGVSVYDPDLDPPDPAGPLVGIASIEVGGEEKNPGGVLRLGDRTGLVVRFEVRSFVDEDGVRFQTRMEGLEAAWGEPFLSPDRKVVFPALPPGTYRFQVRAIDVAGRVSEAAVSAPIEVLPPFWNRGWFLLLLFTVGALGLWLAITHVIQRRYTGRLRGEVMQRTRELALAHEFAESERERVGVTLRSIVDGVLATDPQGRIRLANPAAAAILARSSESLVGEPLFAVFGPDAVERCGGWREMTDAMRLGDAGVRKDCTFRCRIGRETRLLEATLSPIRHGGGLSGVVIAFRDVTERDRLQSEMVRAQKLESVGVLAGGIAHDFNNLLTAILGYLSLVESAPELRSGTRLSARKALDASSRARSLTRQLLTFSRGGAPVRKPVHLQPVVRQSVDLALSGTQVRAEVALADDLLPVEADEGQIGQVLSNLLINAHQALPRGGTVRVLARNAGCVPESLPEGDYVELRVEDDGVGIPPQNLERIFDPYFTTKEQGSGLGLAVAYSIARKHGGLLSAESAAGKGSVFRLFLPATDAEVGPAPETAEEPRVQRGRVLVMDDEAAVRDVVVTMLRRLGYHPDAVGDGREAIDRYHEAIQRREPYGAVILDLTVAGGMGGLETLERLRALDPEVVAIVTSGYSRDRALASHADHGFRAALPKPFEIATLERVMEEALRASPVSPRRR